MDSFVIEGGRALHGEVELAGAKNAALPVMAATILAEGKTVLHRVPRLRDVASMIALLSELGMRVEWIGENSLELEVDDPTRTEAPYDIVKTMRASICALGPLLAKRKRAQVAHPGGCIIGVRPINLHLKGLRALGASVDVEHGDVIAEGLQLFGNDIYLGGPMGSTVLGTANVMCAAVLAEGETVIEEAACEPEIVALARFLNKMGARISNIGSKRLKIEGVEHLRGTEFTIPPDRIEAATFMVAAALTRGNVLVRDARREDMGAVYDAFRQIGVQMIAESEGMRIIGQPVFHHVDLVTGPFPGLPTDCQAQFMALLSLADGISVVTERIYPDRFMHVAELNRMRANIRKEGASAIVQGAEYLSGAPVMSSDLRASAALVLAGLVARGTTTVNRVYHIDRGYEGFDAKLAALGARIERISDGKPAPPD
jgi:UDP-N-acetylglucosamine 1-carboxyvinyltransferase